jgi:hypothetical protein
MKCFFLFRALLVPSGLVSRLGSVHKMNLAVLMAILGVFDAIFPEFNGYFSCERKDL